MLEASRNFCQPAFHRLCCIDKHLTETKMEKGAFNSLLNVVIVNTAGSMECRLTENFLLLEHCVRCRSTRILKATLAHENIVLE